MIRYVDKTTGTYADTLEAVGWASLMDELGVRAVSIVDEGGRYKVEGRGEVDFARPATPGFVFVFDAKNAAPASIDDTLDYEKEREKEKVAREFREATKKKASKRGTGQAADAGVLATPEEPSPKLKLAKMISSMRKGWNADRELAWWLHNNPEAAQQWVESECSGTACSEKPELSNTQLLNPATGKGVSSAKTEARSPGSVPGVLVNPFAEWMKMRGMWTSMAAYRSGDDFKFMVLDPADISIEALKRVGRELSDLNLWGGVRLDIESSLKCTQILIINSEGFHAEAVVSLKKRTPRKVVRGLRQAFFKSLGTAAALMNEAILPLPDWFRIDSRDDANAYLMIIGEAIGELGKARGGCLGVLDEDKSDECSVLQLYRNWLATGDFTDLMEFHHAFGPLMLRKGAAGEYTRLFSSEILSDLLIRSYEEQHMLKEIVENEGFLSVARAIRNTTIYAVGMKSSNREVQFGLAQKWKQKMRAGKGEFSIVLAEFVQANNWEVAHKLKGLGHQIEVADLDKVCELVERHGEELVGSLLLAYGYSRAAKVGTDAVDIEEKQI